MLVMADQKFEFDVQGYMHLRGVISTEEQLAFLKWADEAVARGPVTKDAVIPEGYKAEYLNRPVSRIIDADPRFGACLTHPAVEPFLTEFVGPNYKHIDNDLLFTVPGYKGGAWHRGVREHPTGHVVNGKFICPMVKVFYCLSDVGPGDGEFAVVPGSHRSAFPLELADRVDLPGQHVFSNVRSGDVIIFNEALLHNGRPNVSAKTRKTIVVNLGRSDAGVWQGYAPLPETLAAVTPRQREILSNHSPVWIEPDTRTEAYTALHTK